MDQVRHEEVILTESNSYWIHALHIGLPLGVSMGVIALGALTPIAEIPWYWLLGLLSLMFAAFFYALFYFVLMTGWLHVRLQKWVWVSDGEKEIIQKV